MREHVDDIYVQKAQKEGYRSRAVYKLLEIQERDRLIKPSSVVVDLGAAPGGWSQLARKMIGSKGRIIALDILPMDSLADVEFIQGDFRDQEVLDKLLATVGGQGVDLVMSDMAPNISGTKSVDQPRSIYLAELAMDFARQVLVDNGDLLMKVFQGEGIEELVKMLQGHFTKVLYRKPKASRPRSREVYLLARGYKL